MATTSENRPLHSNLTVLFVCSGNQGRSVACQHICQHHWPSVRFCSAGVHADLVLPCADPQLITLFHEHNGHDLSNHKPLFLTPALLAEIKPSLILVATEAQFEVVNDMLAFPNVDANATPTTATNARVYRVLDFAVQVNTPEIVPAVIQSQHEDPMDMRENFSLSLEEYLEYVSALEQVLLATFNHASITGLAPVTNATSIPYSNATPKRIFPMFHTPTPAPRMRSVVATKRTAIIVLGQSLNADGSPPSTLVSRVARAVLEWQKPLVPRPLLIFTGGDPAHTGTSEAQSMLELFETTLKVDIPRDHIVLEDKSENTLQNAAFCIPLLQQHGCFGDITLVSSEFHLPRAHYIFDAVFAAMWKDNLSNLHLNPSTSTCNTMSLDSTPSSQPTIIPSPAPTPPPHSSDIGRMNSMPLLSRLKLELRYTREKLVQSFLPNHIVNFPVPPLPHQRLTLAVNQIEELIAHCVDLTT